MITVKTKANFNNSCYSLYFPPKLNISSYKSSLEFSEPLIDFKGRENDKLSLMTIWFLPNNPFWQIYINNEIGNSLDTLKFGELYKPFGDYSKGGLEFWQKNAFKIHSIELKNLENLFYEEKRIPCISIFETNKNIYKEEEEEINAHI